MISAEVTTTGLDALIADAPAATMAAIHEANEEIAAIARTLVRVDTGATRDSITVEAASDGDPLGEEVTAGGAAILLELGWHTQGGRAVGPFPFLRPAFDAIWPSIGARVGNHLFVAGQP